MVWKIYRATAAIVKRKEENPTSSLQISSNLIWFLFFLRASNRRKTLSEVYYIVGTLILVSIYSARSCLCVYMSESEKEGEGECIDYSIVRVSAMPKCGGSVECEVLEGTQSVLTTCKSIQIPIDDDNGNAFTTMSSHKKNHFIFSIVSMFVISHSRNTSMPN